MRVLFLIAVCCGLIVCCSKAMAGEPWVITDHSPNQTAAIDVTDYVLSVRSSEGAGGCVPVGNGTFQTCAHIFYKAQGNQLQPSPVGATGNCEVSIKGTWHPATFRVIDNSPDTETALVRVKGDVPAPKRRAPRYMEKVVVYGLTTGYLQCGIVSGPREVSLYENEKGTKSGDSGGGVFSEAGEFLGTVQGSEKAENRVVVFRPNNFEINFAAASSPKPPVNSAPPPATAGFKTVCEGGVCRQVPIDGGSLQQQQQGRPQWKLKTGIFGGKRWVLE